MSRKYRLTEPPIGSRLPVTAAFHVWYAVRLQNPQIADSVQCNTYQVRYVRTAEEFRFDVPLLRNRTSPHCQIKVFHHLEMCIFFCIFTGVFVLCTTNAMGVIPHRFPFIFQEKENSVWSEFKCSVFHRTVLQQLGRNIRLGRCEFSGQELRV